MNLTTVGHPVLGSGAAAFSTSMEAVIDNSETNDQGIQDRIELGNNTLFGTGVISGSYAGNLLAVGVGLSVTVAAHKVLIGFVRDQTSAGTIAVPDNTATVYLWERQDGTYTYTTVNTNPGTTANPAIDLGTCATSGGAVTSVSNTRTEIVIASKGQREEQFSGPWDASADDRTGGTASQVTLSATPATGSLVEVYVDRARWVKTNDWTIAGAVITFVDGARPISGEIVSVVYTPA